MNSFLRKQTLRNIDMWLSSALLDLSWKWRARWLTLLDQLLISLCRLLKELKHLHSLCRTSGNSPGLVIWLSAPKKKKAHFMPFYLIYLHWVWLLRITEQFFWLLGTLCFDIPFFLKACIVYCVTDSLNCEVNWGWLLETKFDYLYNCVWINFRTSWIFKNKVIDV